MCNSKSLLSLIFLTATFGAHAQTILEIEALQRKKIYFDLSKEIGSVSMPASAPTAAPSAAPAKRAPDLPVLAGMGGDPADPRRLTVGVVEGGNTSDYRVGDTTAAGWRVVRIGRRDATFSHPDAKEKSVTVAYGGAYSPPPTAGAAMPPTGNPVPTSSIAR